MTISFLFYFRETNYRLFTHVLWPNCVNEFQSKFTTCPVSDRLDYTITTALSREILRMFPNSKPTRVFSLKRVLSIFYSSWYKISIFPFKWENGETAEVKIYAIVKLALLLFPKNSNIFLANLKFSNTF